VLCVTLCHRWARPRPVNLRKLAMQPNSAFDSGNRCSLQRRLSFNCHKITCAINGYLGRHRNLQSGWRVSELVVRLAINP
jgi:hypothetical protein